MKASPRLAGFVRLDYLPFVKYQVYEKWKPDRVKVLFVAESPPWKGNVYFYNENDEGRRPGGLSSNLFRLLGIEGESKSEKLSEFRRRGFFLVDTIKCIFRKDKGPMPKKLIQFSAREILSREIGSLNPKLILTLGSTALHGLKNIDRFSKALAGFQSVTQACGQSVDIGGVKVVVSVFPNDRNKQYQKRISRAFRQFVLNDVKGPSENPSCPKRAPSSLVRWTHRLLCSQGGEAIRL